MSRERWDERYETADEGWKADENTFLAEELAALIPGRALDLACGRGRNSLWLASKGWTVTGVDFSRVGLAIARALAAERELAVTWIEADVVEWEPPQGQFDLVVVAYLHLPGAQRRQVFSHARSALAPGGVLFVLSHDTSNLVKGTGGPQDPAVLAGPEDIVRCIPTLQVERAERVSRTVETETGERIAIDALVRARLPR